MQEKERKAIEQMRQKVNEASIIQLGEQIISDILRELGYAWVEIDAMLRFQKGWAAK